MRTKSLSPRAGRRLAGLAVCLLAVSLPRCGGAARGTEPVTLTLAIRTHTESHYADLVERFEARYPHVSVELNTFATGNALAEVGAADADVRPVWQAMFEQARERGDLLALDPFVDRDESLVSDLAAPDIFAADGSTWAIVTGLNPIVIYYNRDLFDLYDVPYPEAGWTWDEFLDTALVLRDVEAGVYAYASAHTGNHYDALWFVYQHGGRLYDDLQHPTRVLFNEPATVEALDWYRQLYDEYDVATELLPGGKSVRAGITYGQIAMWSYDFSEQGGQSSGIQWPASWGVVTFPRDTHAATGGLCLGYAISSRTQHPEEAWLLLDFLTRQPWELVIPASRSLLESAEYRQLVGDEFAAVAVDAWETTLLYSPAMYTTFEGTREIFFEAVDSVLDNDWTAKEALDAAQYRAEIR